MDYEQFKNICKTNKIVMQNLAAAIGLTQDGLKKGLISGGLGIRYLVPLCNELSMTPNRFFGVPEQQTTTQTQNGGVGNTQIVEAGITALQEQLKEKDRQIARLLDIVAKQS